MKHTILQNTAAPLMNEQPQACQSTPQFLEPSEYWNRAFCRHVGLINPLEQAILAKACIAIPGLGGVGGSHLLTLVRSGIGCFKIADLDRFEIENTNRQAGARIDTVGKLKTDVLENDAFSINPFLTIEKFPDGITSQNIGTFLEGVDIVVDGIDFFAVDMRRLIFNEAHKRGIPVITVAPIGFSAALLVFLPDRGMSFDEYFDIHDGLPYEEKILRVSLGLAPDLKHLKYFDLTRFSSQSRRSPSLGLACQLCSAVAATEALRLLLGRKGVRPAPHYLRFDPYLSRLVRGYLWRGNRNLIQKLKMYIIRAKVGANSSIQAPELPSPPGRALSEELKKIIVNAALRAPSGDNLQPWKFSWQNRNFSVSIDPSRDNSFFNVKQYASIISCGAAIENSIVAGSKAGFASEVITNSDSPLSFSAKVEFSASSKCVEPLYDAIWRRRTNRQLFKRCDLPAVCTDILRETAAKFKGVELHFLQGPDNLETLSKIIAKIDRIRVEDQRMHEHLMHAIRFSKREELSTQDGLPIKSLEAGLSGELFLRATRSWKMMSSLVSLGIGKLVANRAALGMKYSSAALLITVPETSPESYFVGGRAMQRIWLQCEHLGLGVQPMSAGSLFQLRLQLEGNSNFLSHHRALLTRSLDQFQTLFGLREPENKGQLMLFRIGFSNHRAVPTLRRDPSSFIESKDC